MPTNCLGCGKRKTALPFRPLDHVTNPLEFLNNRRILANTKRRRTNQLGIFVEIPVYTANPICQICYNSSLLIRQTTIHDETPDLLIYRQGNNAHTRCTFGCRNFNNLIAVPRNFREKLMIEYQFYTVPNSRMCSTHLESDNLWPVVKLITRQPESQLEYRTILDFQRECFCNRNARYCTFDMKSFQYIDEDLFSKWHGYSKAEFEQICAESDCDFKYVAPLLCKMRTGTTNELLGTLYGVSESTISRNMKIALSKMSDNLVPLYLNNFDRTEMLAHNTPIAKQLYDMSDDQLCTIWDASYRFAGKSANFSAQKQMYSLQKKRALYKPMVGVAPDGYILYVLGPFKATRNDANIMSKCWDDEKNGTLSELRPGDVMVTDRGFRDCVELFENEGFVVKLPESKLHGETQLNTLSANRNRFVTKTRWVIELTFGRLKKKFKFFEYAAHNGALENDFSIMLVAFALLNMFRADSPILSDTDYPGVVEIMKARLNLPNKLQTVVDNERLRTIRLPFVEINDNSQSIELLFPQLSEEDLHYISCGSFQIANAFSYYQLHTADTEGVFNVTQYEPRNNYPEIDFEEYDIDVTSPILVKAKMKSRFKGSVIHHVFVLADNDKQGKDAIIEYYCTCETGARTVGCCSHIMTIIWYLGHAHSRDIQVPNPDLSDMFI